MSAPRVAGDRRLHGLRKAGAVILYVVAICPPVFSQDIPKQPPPARLGFSESLAAPLQPTAPPGPIADLSITSIIPVVNKEEIATKDNSPPSSLTSDLKAAAFVGSQPPDGNIDPAVVPANCPTCGTGPKIYQPPLHVPPPIGHHHGKPKVRDTLFQGCLNCGVGQCVPGQGPCYPCEHTETAAGRFICNLYQCLCCPDPCYEPEWLPIANSAFFVDGTRPVSQTRLRWDRGINMILADRSEFFYARADGNGKGPNATAPAITVPRLDYHELSMYTEVATGKLSVIVDMPYRSLDPEFAAHTANFADMNIATKTLLFDCELLQVAFMMRTYLPIGSPGKGLGTGHVSLEPSLIFGIKLHPDAYFQGQVAEWIPLGGDPTYAGAILHYHFSVNQVLVRLLPDVPLIGTLEMSGFSFQDGAFTDPVFGPFQQSSGETYIYLGGGLRMFVCDRIDFGFGVNLALTKEHFSDALFRSEFRFRY